MTDNTNPNSITFDELIEIMNDQADETAPLPRYQLRRLCVEARRVYSDEDGKVLRD